MEFGIEKCNMRIIKSETRQITKGIEVLNQQMIITLGEKENHKYLGILETDTIKQDKKRSTSEKQENSAAEISSKG